MDSRAITMVLVAAFFAIPAITEGQSTPPPVRSLAPTGRGVVERGEIPREYLPPKGMCRIWIDNVPPARQPAPTDCATAIKKRPSNGRVIFPEDAGRAGSAERERDGGRASGADTTADTSSRDAKRKKLRRP